MCRLLGSTPTADGFRMPAEWEAHRGTWLLWPERPQLWPFGGKAARVAFAELATAISRFEPVSVGVNHAQFDNARTSLPPEVRVVEIAQDDAWARDSGPTFVVNDAGEVRLVDWVFNSWGLAQLACDKDDRIPGAVAEIEGVDRYRAPLVMEGGAFHVDGEGSVLTTRECLLNPNRNPTLAQEQIEGRLKEYLGASKVIWLDRGLDPDVTSGHVDDVAMFVAPGEVALAWTEDESDWRHEVQSRNLEILETTTDARGRHLKVHKVPLPAEVIMTDAEFATVELFHGMDVLPSDCAMPASYINCVLCNGGVVMPVFDDPADEPAKAIYEELFPDREIVALPGRDIVVGGGCFHCVSQQQPAGRIE
jgi:agmatine deiminase